MDRAGTARATTFLFVPGDRPDRFAKALASGADRVILDLEDAVAPAAKRTARAAVADALTGASEPDRARLILRVNDAGSGWFADDLDLLSALRPGSVLLPKAERRGALDMVAAAAGGAVTILPQIETVAGLEGVAALLSHPRAGRAVFGHLDFALDLGAAPEWEALLMARARLVYLSRLAGAPAPVDSITPEIADPARAGTEAQAARRLGFGGKLLIHPAQVAPVAAAFRPTEAEIAWARRVRAALATGTRGTVAVDGKMVDRPVEHAARRILSHAGEDDV